MGSAKRVGQSIPTCQKRRRGDATAGQATVEFVLALSVILLFLAGIVAIGRINNGRVAVLATAREAARSAALGTDPADAIRQGLARGEATGTGYGLTNGSLTIVVDANAFGPGGYVRTAASYRVRLSNLPLLRMADVPLRATAQELIPQHMTLAGQR